MRGFLRTLGVIAAVALLGDLCFAQEAVEASAVLTDDPGEGSLSTAVEIAVLLTVLSLLPAILVTVTSFTRIVIVLSFVRRALSVNELPPNPVIIGLALFLTCFVMAPVAERVNETALEPYNAGELSFEEAGEAAWGELRGFLVANTREAEIQLFVELSNHQSSEEASEELPMSVIVPAFVLSELKTAFVIAVKVYLPFLVIDIVIANVLLSMGMMVLPPVIISLPFKLMLFILMDGWNLLVRSMAAGFGGV